MMKLLSVLVPALSNRHWQTMVDELHRQASEHHGNVEVLVEVDDGRMTSGQKRNKLTDLSAGQYICFVDDDDWVEPDYVSSLVDGCELGVDVVTFDLHMQIPRNETWRFGLHLQCRESGQMTANHLCAWKRELATKVRWNNDLGYADDQCWYQPLFFSDLAKTEHHIDRVLYHYQFDYATTQNQKRARVEYSRRYVGAGLKCYRLQDELFVEACLPRRGVLRDRHGNSVEYKVGMEHYHTIRIA